MVVRRTNVEEFSSRNKYPWTTLTTLKKTPFLAKDQSQNIFLHQ